ncbi:MAG: four-carbon acid sugar kinase family protein [Lachnospiraceae bacterium]|nr:four-carbon acid sugar kinase family protein [Lachnospiraceae bacterium]
MPLIGAVADDLTGAMTTGDLLARSRARTAVFFNEQAALRAEGVSSLDAILISSNSRPLLPVTAKKYVGDATTALKNMGVKYFSKRIDTTLRGGIGHEIDAMMDVIGGDVIAVVVPAMPQSRRILVGGYSVIDSVSLIRTPVAQDVRTPVKENYIPDLLAAQTEHKVGLVELRAVLSGKDAVKSELAARRGEGCGVIIVDAVSIEDVQLIAEACVELNWDVLAVDPGPFTAKLAQARGLIGEERPNIPDEAPVENKTVLIAAGSATPVTKKQMEILCKDERNIRISVEPVPLIDGGDAAQAEVDRAVDRASICLNQEETPRAVLFETALHGELLNLDEEDKKRGYAGGRSADMINIGLGMIIEKVLKREGREKIAGLYTTGGDTMVNVCTQLGVECLEVIDYVIPQTDIGRLIGAYDGLPIIGKGGLTGTNTTAIEIVDRLMLEAARK